MMHCNKDPTCHNQDPTQPKGKKKDHLNPTLSQLVLPVRPLEENQSWIQALLLLVSISSWVKPCQGDRGARSESGRSSRAWASPRICLDPQREANTKVLPPQAFSGGSLDHQTGGRGREGKQGAKGEGDGEREGDGREKAGLAKPYFCRFLG